MGLTRYKLGDLIEQSDERNGKSQYSLESVRGISIEKVFIPTKAKMDGVSLIPYKLVRSGYFSFVPVTSRNGNKITIALNSTDCIYINSSSYTVFKVARTDLLNPSYLFMLFNRPEFDRYSRFNSWGSARETFTWEDMCDVEIDLPPIEIQQKYVDIYNAMVANQKCYEDGLEDLKLACDAELETLMAEMQLESIGSHIQLVDERNSGSYTTDSVRGISIEKIFIPTKAKMDRVSVNNYKIVEPRDIAYVPVTSRNGGKITIAQNTENESCLISSAYISFRCNEAELLPEYLMLFFTRPEFDRYARFHSWGSAREVFSWEDMQEVRIPIPDIEIQESLADLFTAYNQRREINERMKAQMKDICPILIKGSLEEASKS